MAAAQGGPGRDLRRCIWFALFMALPAPDDSSRPPEWFLAAIATPAKQAAVEVDGASIAYRTYGDREDRGIVLVHGGAAHAHWWDHIAPLLAVDHMVVALDLSGHGDSGRREAYGLDMWAQEVLAVVADAGITAPPTVIGHSMGGLDARYMVSRLGMAERVKSLTTVATPHRGSAFADWGVRHFGRRAVQVLSYLHDRSDLDNIHTHTHTEWCKARKGACREKRRQTAPEKKERTIQHR